MLSSAWGPMPALAPLTEDLPAASRLACGASTFSAGPQADAHCWSLPPPPLSPPTLHTRDVHLGCFARWLADGALLCAALRVMLRGGAQRQPQGWKQPAPARAGGSTPRAVLLCVARLAASKGTRESPRRAAAPSRCPGWQAATSGSGLAAGLATPLSKFREAMMNWPHAFSGCE